MSNTVATMTVKYRRETHGTAIINQCDLVFFLYFIKIPHCGSYRKNKIYI